jgi:hypothetical protein
MAGRWSVSPWLLGLGALILGGGAVSIYKSYKEKGIRNNNPGNIEYNPNIKWQGQIGLDGVYLIFDTPQNGIRALAKDLHNKMARGLKTIATIIPVYAPPSENNTAAYIADVSKDLGVGPAITLNDSHLPAFVKAIIKHENGIQPYPDDLIAQGIALI